MTDKELLIEFLTRLGLKQEDEAERYSGNPSAKGFMVFGTAVVVGEGLGYYNFRAEFTFDVAGKAVSHAVLE